MRVHTYKGKDILVHFAPKLCIHSGECLRGLPEVFNNAQTPWVSPNAASAAEIAEIIRQCPTGALHYTLTDGSATEPIPSTNSLRLVSGGPMNFRGDLHLEWPDGSERVDTRMSLCRCGASQNPPICDGAHRRLFFRDPGQVFSPESITPQAEDGGVLRLSLVEDGPLMSDGPLLIQNAQGRYCCRTECASLCRCGASETKPYCDGSHQKLGFKG